MEMSAETKHYNLPTLGVCCPPNFMDRSSDVEEISVKGDAPRAMQHTICRVGMQLSVD